MRARTIRRLISVVRKWPIHPQWLLAISGEGRDLDRAVSGLAGWVLDIGCANKHVAGRLAEGAHYVGLDYPGTAVAMYGTRPDIFADARALPFRDASMDAVILKDVLEHVDGPGAALIEIARVLREDGKLVLWMPFIYPIHDAPQDFQRFTSHGLRTRLDRHGFAVLDLEPVLRPIETAALMYCLALADAAEQILVCKRWLLPIVPLIAIMVLFSNLIGKGLSWLPSTRFMPASYRVVAQKRHCSQG